MDLGLCQIACEASGRNRWQALRFMSDDNDRLRDYYDANASIYDRWMRSYDRLMLCDARRRLCQLGTGTTLELAVGTGLNLAHYRTDVDLVAADYSSKTRDPLDYLPDIGFRVVHEQRARLGIVQALIAAKP
jgi:hypothetical protein